MSSNEWQRVIKRHSRFARNKGKTAKIRRKKTETNVHPKRATVVRRRLHKSTNRRARRTGRRTLQKGCQLSGGEHRHPQARRTTSSNRFQALQEDDEESEDDNENEVEIVQRLSFRKEKQHWNELSVVTHNVQGYTNNQACKKDHIASFLNKDKKSKATIYLVQETWEKDNNTTEVEGCLFLSNGNPENTRKHGGVGIILSPEAVKAWERAGQPEPIRPPPVASATRSIAIEIKMEDKKKKEMKIFLISTYLPCSSFSDEDFEETLNQLQFLIDKCPTDAILIIGGDFNASIGVTRKEEGYKSTGPYGNPHRNQRGETVKNFLDMNALTSVATFFEKANHDTWSFAGTGEDPKQIDHILVRQADRKRMRNCTTDDRAGVLSDHYAVRANMRLAKFIPRKTQKAGNSRTGEMAEETAPAKKAQIDWTSARDNEKRRRWNDEITRQIEQSTAREIEYGELTAIMEDAARKTLDAKSRKRPPWFINAQENLLQLINARNKSLREHHRDRDNAEKKVVAKKARTALRKGKDQAKENWLSKKVEELEKMDENPKSSWKAIYELAAGINGHHKPATVMKMKMTDGTFAQTPDQNCRVHAEHYRTLYNQVEKTSYDPSILNEITEIPENQQLADVPDTAEIGEALKRMQYEKSPGPNGIPTEAFKNLQGEGLAKLVGIIQKVWTDEYYIPGEWSQIKLTVLPKKGNLSDPNKWRGIALGDIAVGKYSRRETRAT
eukprot:scaffold8028_cov81-Cylindrotheca_fusiformis.AAC.1